MSTHPDTLPSCSSENIENQGPTNQAITNPSTPSGNNGYDNTNSDLIVYANEIMHNTQNGHLYTAYSVVGQGTFGQVVKCWSHELNKYVAVKIIKNHDAYFHQARVEIGILRHLNQNYDVDQHNIVRLYDFFTHKGHLCIVFELLNINLFELLKINGYSGLKMQLVRFFIKQILDSLCTLKDEMLIHCDLKPENILLRDCQTGLVKIIDFGSACIEHKTVYSYIQSRYYRSPEVVVGYPYSPAIDMWSLGCIAAELFLGLPLFPAASERDLLAQMIDILGPLPDDMLKEAKHANRYFDVVEDYQDQDEFEPINSNTTDMFIPENKIKYRLLNEKEFEAKNSFSAPSGRRYFKDLLILKDIIYGYPFKGQDKEMEIERRKCFVNFLYGLLSMDPRKRWTPKQAKEHPFITGGVFTGSFTPTPAVAPKKHPLSNGMAIPSSRKTYSASWQPRPMPFTSSYTNQFNSPIPASIHEYAHRAAMAAIEQLHSYHQTGMASTYNPTMSLSFNSLHQQPLINNPTIGISPNYGLHVSQQVNNTNMMRTNANANANQSSYHSANAFPMMCKTAANSINSLGGGGGGGGVSVGVGGNGHVQASPGTFGNSFSSNPSYLVGNSLPANSVNSNTMHAAIRAIQQQRQQLESTSCSSQHRQKQQQKHHHHHHHHPNKHIPQQHVQWTEEPKINNIKLNENMTEESKTVIGFSVMSEPENKEIKGDSDSSKEYNTSALGQPHMNINKESGIFKKNSSLKIKDQRQVQDNKQESINHATFDSHHHHHNYNHHHLSHSHSHDDQNHHHRHQEYIHDVTSRYKASGVHNNCLDDGSANALTGVPSFSNMVNYEDLDRNASTTNQSIEEDQFSLSINEDNNIRKEQNKFQGFVSDGDKVKINENGLSDNKVSNENLIKDTTECKKKLRRNSCENEDTEELNENRKLGSVKEQQQQQQQLINSKSLNSDGGNNEFEMLYEKARKGRDREGKASVRDNK